MLVISDTKWDQWGWGRGDLAAAVVEVGVSVDRAGDPDPCGYGAWGGWTYRG